jgi:hypothetical protein
MDSLQLRADAQPITQHSSSGARGVKEGGFKGAVNSKSRLEEADSRSKRANIHKPKSASPLRFADVLSAKRYMTYQVRVVGPSEGTTRFGSKFGEAYFEGIPKAREMKA